MAGGRLPAVNGRRTIQALSRAGFVVDRIAGSHHVLAIPGDPTRTVTVLVHAGHDLKPGTLRSIIRQAGLTAGIELVRDWQTREPFDLRERAGIRVCEAMAARGVLTRPIGNVIVLMPPYCTTPAQLEKIIHVTHKSIAEVLFQGS